MSLIPEVLSDSNGFKSFKPITGCTTPAITSGSIIEIPTYQKLDFRISQPRGQGVITIPGSVILIGDSSRRNSLVVIERHPLRFIEPPTLKPIQISDLLPHGTEPKILEETGLFQRERWTQANSLVGITFSEISTALEMLKSPNGRKRLINVGISTTAENYINLIMLLWNSNKQLGKQRVVASSAA